MNNKLSTSTKVLAHWLYDELNSKELANEICCYENPEIPGYPYKVQVSFVMTDDSFRIVDVESLDYLEHAQILKFKSRYEFPSAFYYSINRKALEQALTNDFELLDLSAHLLIPIKRKNLIEFLTTLFSFEELIDLCMDIELNHLELSGGISSQVETLVNMVLLNNKMVSFIELIKEKRQNADWNKLFY